MHVTLNPSNRWVNAANLPGLTYTCGYCNTVTGAHRGFYHGTGDARSQNSRDLAAKSVYRIYLCGKCELPTFTDSDGTFFAPSARQAGPVNHLPTDVAALYEEIRVTGPITAPSLVMLGCRKMLMHVAVERGAAENKNFLFYVDHLADNHIIPEGSKPWVDKLRSYGNEATHSIDVVSRDDASKALKFVEMLLRIVYEFPADVV